MARTKIVSKKISKNDPPGKSRQSFFRAVNRDRTKIDCGDAMTSEMEGLDRLVIFAGSRDENLGFWRERSNKRIQTRRQMVQPPGSPAAGVALGPENWPRAVSFLFMLVQLLPA